MAVLLLTHVPVWGTTAKEHYKQGREYYKSGRLYSFPEGFCSSDKNKMETGYGEEVVEPEKRGIGESEKNASQEILCSNF